MNFQLIKIKTRWRISFKIWRKKMLFSFVEYYGSCCPWSFYTIVKNTKCHHRLPYNWQFYSLRSTFILCVSLSFHLHQSRDAFAKYGKRPVEEVWRVESQMRVENVYMWHAAGGKNDQTKNIQSNVVDQLQVDIWLDATPN